MRATKTFNFNKQKATKFDQHAKVDVTRTFNFFAIYIEILEAANQEIELRL